jgi:hypothetical protein
MNIAQQTKLYGDLTFEQSKALHAEFLAKLEKFGKPLRDAPKAANGATLDSAKSALWKRARTEHSQLHEEARWHTAYHTRTFKKQLAAERKAKIEARTKVMA